MGSRKQMHIEQNHVHSTHANRLKTYRPQLSIDYKNNRDNIFICQHNYRDVQIINAKKNNLPFQDLSLSIKTTICLLSFCFFMTVAALPDFRFLFSPRIFLFSPRKTVVGGMKKVLFIPPG